MNARDLIRRRGDEAVAAGRWELAAELRSVECELARAELDQLEGHVMLRAVKRLGGFATTETIEWEMTCPTL